MFLTSIASWLKKEWGKSSSLPPTLISRIKIVLAFFSVFRIANGVPENEMGEGTPTSSFVP